MFDLLENFDVQDDVVDYFHERNEKNQIELGLANSSVYHRCLNEEEKKRK